MIMHLVFGYLFLGVSRDAWSWMSVLRLIPTTEDVLTLLLSA